MATRFEFGCFRIAFAGPGSRQGSTCCRLLPSGLIIARPPATMMSRHGVVEFAKKTANAHLTELGRSSEGRSIPLLIVADPPVKTAAEAARSGKLVCFIIGNIHAGEVCGKEALPMLLRETFGDPHPPLLKDLILAVAPIYNTDGNERVSKSNRPGQVGPEEGMGQRANARGLDLNRDFIKLEAPETRGLVHFLNLWNPHLFIDTHTTDGSYHQYIMTYEGPKNPAGDRGILEFMRQSFFPEVGSAFAKQTGLKSFYYGNFNREHTQWTTYPAEARYSTTYVGLRNRLAVLTEAYSHAPFKTRVLATRDYVGDCLAFAASHKAAIVTLLDDARRAATRADGPNQIAVLVPLRSREKAAAAPATVLGFVEKMEERPPRQDRRTEGIQAPIDERVRADRDRGSTVRLPDPADGRGSCRNTQAAWHRGPGAA